MKNTERKRQPVRVSLDDALELFHDERFAGANRILPRFVHSDDLLDAVVARRAIGSKVSIVVTHAKKGQAFGRYWSKLAFTKIIEWGAQFRRVAEYVELNQMEAQLGYLPEYRRKKRRPPVARGKS